MGLVVGFREPCQFLNLVSVGRRLSVLTQFSDLDVYGLFEDSGKLVRIPWWQGVAKTEVTRRATDRIGGTSTGYRSHVSVSDSRFHVGRTPSLGISVAQDHHGA